MSIEDLKGVTTEMKAKLTGLSEGLDIWFKAHKTKEPTAEEKAEVESLNRDIANGMLTVGLLDEMASAMNTAGWDPAACQAIMKVAILSTLNRVKKLSSEAEVKHMTMHGVNLEKFKVECAKAEAGIKELLSEVTDSIQEELTDKPSSVPAGSTVH